MEQTPRAFFQTTFESIGRVCAARHARGGLGMQGKWRTRACVPHTPYIRATACSPRGRELERGQQAARLVFEWLRNLGKVAEIRGMPSPQPSPTGEGAGCSRFCGCKRFENGMCYMINPIYVFYIRVIVRY